MGNHHGRPGGGWDKFNRFFLDGDESEGARGDGDGGEDEDRKAIEGEEDERDGESYCALDRINVSQISTTEFLQKYILGGRPVVIEGIVDEWPAVQKWAYDAFVETYGEIPINVSRSTAVVTYHVRATQKKEQQGTVKMTVAEYVETTVMNKEKDPHKRLYFIDNQLEEPIKDDWNYVPYLEYFNRGGDELYKLFFLGAPGTSFYFHQHTSAFNMLLYGRKRWKILPPNAVYNQERGQLLQDLPREVTDNWPVRPLECVQQAGETIFVPQNWVHSLTNERLAVGIATEVGLVTPTYRLKETMWKP